MPSKGGLIYYRTCSVYVPYLGKFKTLKIMNLTSNCAILANAKKLRVKP